MKDVTCFTIFLLVLEAFCPGSFLQKVSAHTLSRIVDTIHSIYFIDRFMFKPFQENDKILCYPVTNGTEVIDVNADGELVRCVESEEFGTAFWNIRYDATHFPGARLLVFTDQDSWRDVYISVYGGYDIRPEDAHQDALTCKEIIDKAQFEIQLDESQNQPSWYNTAFPGDTPRRSNGRMFFPSKSATNFYQWQSH